MSAFKLPFLQPHQRKSRPRRVQLRAARGSVTWRAPSTQHTTARLAVRIHSRTWTKTRVWWTGSRPIPWPRSRTGPTPAKIKHRMVEAECRRVRRVSVETVTLEAQSQTLSSSPHNKRARIRSLLNILTNGLENLRESCVVDAWSFYPSSSASFVRHCILAAPWVGSVDLVF